MRLQSYAKFFNHQTFPDYFSAFLRFLLFQMPEDLSESGKNSQKRRPSYP